MLSAQPSHPPKNQEARKAHRAEINSFIETEVLPVVGAERQALDQQLSAEDQAEIQQIRTELSALKSERMQRHKGMRPPRGEERPELSEEERAEMRATKKAHRLLMTRAWSIADAYEAEIEGHLESLRPQAEAWKTQLKDLHQAHRPEDAQPKRDRSERAEGHPRRGHRHEGAGGRVGRGPQRMFQPLHSPVAFLLFDPEAPLPEFPQEETASKILQAFPNPASASTTLRYELPEASLIKIEILDPQGNVLKSNPPVKQAAGVQNTTLSLEGLQPGVYLIRLMSKEGAQTEKIVVE